MNSNEDSEYEPCSNVVEAYQLSRLDDGLILFDTFTFEV
jgi:hypothetical protein